MLKTGLVGVGWAETQYNVSSGRRVLGRGTRPNLQLYAWPLALLRVALIDPSPLVELGMCQRHHVEF